MCSGLEESGKGQVDWKWRQMHGQASLFRESLYDQSLEVRERIMQMCGGCSLWGRGGCVGGAELEQRP